MANTISTDATNYVREVARIHSTAIDFINFIEAVKAGIGSNYSSVLDIPSKVSYLLVRKANFDARSIPYPEIKSILEKNHGYTDWTPTHTADFNAIFTKAVALRTAVESNAAEFPPTYDAQHQIQYTTAEANVQTALTNLIDGILLSVE